MNLFFGATEIPNNHLRSMKPCIIVVYFTILRLEPHLALPKALFIVGAQASPVATMTSPKFTENGQLEECLNKTTWKGRKKHIFCSMYDTNVWPTFRWTYTIHYGAVWERNSVFQKRIKGSKSGNPTCSSPKFHENWDHLEPTLLLQCAKLPDVFRIKHVFRPWVYLVLGCPTGT